MGVAAVLVLAGCAVPRFGGPAEPPPFVGIELPPRPYDIDVRDVNPCDLLTEEQRAGLGLETPPRFTPNEGSVLFEGPEPLCTSLAFDPVAFDVAVAVPYDGLGIGALTGRPVSSELTALDVAGFPAVLARPTDPTFCQVLVDVAPGAALSAGMREGGRGTVSQDELCDGAVELTNLAMRTLLSIS